MTAPLEMLLCLSGDPYVFCLKALRTFYHVEGHGLVLLKAADVVALKKYAKTSSPFERLRKPNPLASLNHTVPRSIALVPSG